MAAATNEPITEEISFNRTDGLRDMSQQYVDGGCVASYRRIRSQGDEESFDVRKLRTVTIVRVRDCVGVLCVRAFPNGVEED